MELVPPKPKELERNTSKCLDILSAGIKSRAESSSGFSKFRFAAMKSFFIISIEYQISGHGYYAPIYDLQVRFLRAATVDDTLLVTITWKPAEGAKLCFDYEIRNEKDNELILRASTVQLFTTEDGEFDPVGPAFFQEWKDKMLSE